METIGKYMGKDGKIEIINEETPFDADRRDKLLKLSKQRLYQKYKDRQARSYRELFTKLVGEPYSDYHDEFQFHETQFGLYAVQDAVEYMAMRSSKWGANQFLSYLLKVLQSGREELELTVDSSTERQREIGKRLLHEAKTWQVLKGIIL